jgi:alpha-1,3-mannosyl-glycoprotein beta-1,2-N-acetylglucosaminyltransferase
MAHLPSSIHFRLRSSIHLLCLSVVNTQDDMRIAPDFFSYFEAGAALLDRDPSLWCISAWNDHGSQDLVADPKRLYRSDFFPGLGWMLTRDTWDTLRDSWCG